MLPLPKFIKPWKDAGEANALFAPCCLLTSMCFLQKLAALGVVFELAGIDSQCLTDGSDGIKHETPGRCLACVPRRHPALSICREAPVALTIDQQRQYETPVSSGQP